MAHITVAIFFIVVLTGLATLLETMFRHNSDVVLAALRGRHVPGQAAIPQAGATRPAAARQRVHAVS